MPAGENASVHLARIVIEAHLDPRRAHARPLSAATHLAQRPVAAEEHEAGHPDRNADGELAHEKKPRASEHQHGSADQIDLPDEIVRRRAQEVANEERDGAPAPKGGAGRSSSLELGQQQPRARALPPSSALSPPAA